MKAEKTKKQKPRTLFLEEMTTVAVERVIAQEQPLFLPIGTLEAHGRHLPVGTDTLCAKGVALELARRFGGVVAPPVSYGLTNLLAQTAPASFFPDDLFRSFVEATVKSFVRHGFKKIIIVNGHGGNRNALMNLARGIVREHSMGLCVIHWWALAEPFAKIVYGGAGGHAAVEETAAMIVFHPELVDSSLYAPEHDDFAPDDGIWCYPPPGEVLLYGNDPKGRPDFNPVAAKRFMGLVLDNLQQRMERWLKGLKRFKEGLRS